MEINERGKNELLVEFNFLVDLDMALFRYIQANYSNSKYVDQRIINMKNEYRILEMLLSRKHINPLEIIMPKVETTNLYNELHNTHEENIDYMITLLRQEMGEYYVNGFDTSGLTFHIEKEENEEEGARGYYLCLGLENIIVPN